MWGSIASTLTYMEFCKRVGIEQMLNEMGWQHLVRFPDFAPGARVQMVVVPIPGMRTFALSTVRGFVVSALTYCRMPPALPEADSRVKVQVNLWGSLLLMGISTLTLHPAVSPNPGTW